MKKLLLVALVLAVGVVFAAQSFADVKAKEEVKTTAKKEVTKTEVKGDNASVKSKVVDKADKSYGKTKFQVKDGIIKDLNIKWVYKMENDNYVTEYNVLEKANKKLISELNLTPAQAELIKPGKHKVVSTSPYTGEDIKNNIRAAVLKDLAAAVKK